MSRLLTCPNCHHRLVVGHKGPTLHVVNHKENVNEDEPPPFESALEKAIRVSWTRTPPKYLMTPHGYLPYKNLMVPLKAATVSYMNHEDMDSPEL